MNEQPWQTTRYFTRRHFENWWKWIRVVHLFVPVDGRIGRTCTKFNFPRNNNLQTDTRNRWKKSQQRERGKKKKKTFPKNPDVIAILGFSMASPFVHRRHTTSKSVSLSDRNSAYVFLFSTRGISSTVDSCSAKKFKLRALCETLTRLRQSPQMNQKWAGLLLLGEGRRKKLGGRKRKAGGGGREKDEKRFGPIPLKNSYGCFTATKFFEAAIST